MSQYDFLMLNEEEARDTVARRLWSNGYMRIYDVFSVDVEAGDILLSCHKCGRCIRVHLKDIENGSISKVCRGCIEREKEFASRN